MAKGDDSIRKKKNKSIRKKLQKDPSSVTVRVASIIASKKRRKSGKRRICEGMCFSLPTSTDPFNDRIVKTNLKKEENKKRLSSQTAHKLYKNGKRVLTKKGKVDLDFLMSEEQTKIHGIGGNEDLGCPSKFLIMCLNSIQAALQLDGTYNNIEDSPLFVNTWGIEFWKFYSVGKDILETSGPGPSVEKIAWIASTAADAIARKEKQGLSFDSPFLLFLVPSQEKATKVRAACKPLKPLGIHTVSLHSGASIDHQIQGLKCCEPEFLVSTPERLLELIAVKAINLSGVSVMVIDGMEILSGGCYVDVIKSIRQSILGSLQTIVFSDCLSYASVNMVHSLLTGPICRLSINGCMKSQSACIFQSIHVFASQEEKLSQGAKVLNEVCSSKSLNSSKVLIVVSKESKFCKLVGSLKSQNSMRNVSMSVITIENINRSDFEDYEVVMLPDFVPTIDNYVQILTSMARHTCNGVLHSFFSSDNESLAGRLIEILEQCGQTPPDSLRNVCLSQVLE